MSNNLKIRVSSESQAEEVKRLAVKAGYKLDALFSKWSAKFCYLVLCKDMSAGFANEIMADGDKPLSIRELRAMANPMKEYLMPSRNYEYILTDAREALEPHAKDWIEIPEGMNFAYKDDMYTHFTKMEMGYRDAEIIWQRATHPEELPFIDDEPTKQDLIDLSNKSLDTVLNTDLSQPMELESTLDERKIPEIYGTVRVNPDFNEQYAEIEQVRQAEIHGTVKAELDLNFGAAQSSGGVDATLAERQSTYGNFEDVAFVTENIMSILAKVRVNGLDDFPNTHRMALYMIASKMARIVNGDFNHLDSWHDIGGYAKLIEKLIKGE